MLNETLHTEANPNGTHSVPYGSARAATKPVKRLLASEWTAEQDELIRWAYGTRSLGERKERVPIITGKLNRTVWQCYCRAKQLDCLYPLQLKGRTSWSQAEDAVIEDSAHLKPPAIAKRLRRAGFSRSESAIIQRRWQLGIDARAAKVDAGFYNADQAAVVLGVSGLMVCNFIKRGWLSAVKEGSSATHEWRITEKALRDFIIHHTAQVRFDKADKYLLVDVLCPRHGLKNPGADDSVGVAGEGDSAGRFTLGDFA